MQPVSRCRNLRGIKNDELGSGANHHTPEFDLDEDGLTYGTAAAVSYVWNTSKTRLTLLL